MAKTSARNPILNNPYEEPLHHYSTNEVGELDYENVIEGRRPFIEIANDICDIHNQLVAKIENLE